MSAGKARLPPGEQLPRGVQVAPLISDYLSASRFWLAPRLGQTLQRGGQPHRTASPNGLSELLRPREGNV